jgi:dTDP-4-dehydrorhamnose reductase
MNEYGRQKVEVESAIQGSCDNFLIARLSGVFGWEAGMKNFVCQLIRTLESGRPMRLAADQVYNPTYVVNMVDVLANLLLKGERGIFHLVGADRTTRLEFGREVAEAFGLATSLLIPASLAELGSPTPRPLRTGLLPDKALRCSGLRLWGIHESLAHMRSTRSTIVGTAAVKEDANG